MTCGPTSRRGAQRDQPGQASVEVLGVAPAVVLVGLVVLQLLAVGYARVLAGGAAEAGALALAGGRDPGAAVRQALPGWTRARARIGISGRRVRVRLQPPSPLRAVGRRLTVTSEARIAG